MVTAQSNDDPLLWRLVIEPNSSLTWRQSMAFLLGTSAVTLSIGLVFAFKGYWMILPFAGFEVLALAVCLHLVASAAQRREIVSISDALVTIEKGTVRRAAGRGGPEWSAEFPRVWTRIELTKSSSERYPSRLWVGAYGKRVELAGFLPEEEKRGLAAQLRQLVCGPDGEKESQRQPGLKTDETRFRRGDQ